MLGILVTILAPIKAQAYQIILGQLVIIVGLAVTLFVLRDLQVGYSVLMGGLANWLPTWILVSRVFSRASVRQAKGFLIAFLAAEVGKLLIGAVLFLCVVNFLSAQVVWALTGFIGAIVSFWIAAIIFLNRHQGVSQ